MTSRLAATFAAGLLALSAWAGPGNGPVVIAYVFPHDQPIVPADIAADHLTHINYAFAVVRDGLVVERVPTDAANLKALVELRRTHPHLAVLVSVGGWTDSGGFSDAVLTAESRRRFVESAVDFVVRHDIDGFDVDWEYPGLPGYGNTHRPEDRENFTAVMAALRAAFDRKGAETGRRYLLTFAAGAFSDFLAHVEMDKVQASVDFVNLMTYDFREAGADPEAGHHANLYPNPLDPKQSSGDRAVREFLAAGVPAAKLVLGVPFYGRAWGDVKPEGNGLYQPGKEVGEPVDTSYASLARDYVDRNGYRRIWDDRAQAPFLWNAEKRVFISYEDPESLRVKSRYVLDRGLGGVMFWEYNSDRTGALLETLWRGLRSPGSAERGTDAPGAPLSLGAGFRWSVYGPKRDPGPAYWPRVGQEMAARIPGATPEAIWIVSRLEGEGTALNFPADTQDPLIAAAAEDGNETALRLFDERGYRVWLQVEPGNASVEKLIHLILDRYGHHRSVIGVGVDVEWYKSTEKPEGKPVSDAEAAAWLAAVRSHAPRYRLFLKHWEAGMMPPTLRDGLLFVDDGQILPSLDAMVESFARWGKAFAPAPVAFQFGYPSDRPWWRKLDDPPRDIGARILAAIPNTAGLYWVDFTVLEVFPPER